MLRLSFILLLVVSSCALSFAQDIPISLRNETLYVFIEELAEEHYIVTNQVIKPYTLEQVDQWLIEAGASYYKMNRRMRQEWLFYSDNVLWYQEEDSVPLMNRIDLSKGNLASLSLAPLGVYSHTDNVYFSGTPILNTQFINNKNGTYYHRSYGVAFNLAVNNLSMYANLQDYAEKIRLDDPAYLINGTGGEYKALDYSEMRGGISYANDWFKLGLVKDNFTWGTNQHGSNILSERAPAYTYLRLTVKPLSWFEFNYVHGWLVSNVIDSSESYVQPNGIRRDVMHGKFVAANMFTLYPFKTLNVSFGNSVIYSADNAKLPYLNPVMFYKSVDHTYNSTDGVGKNVGQNSQMFFDVSFKGIKHCFFYYTLMVDELKIERWKHKDEHNFYSYKTGLRISNLIPNTAVGVEFTKTLPITYQHDIITTTFASNDYNLGHYLRDNAKEFYTYVNFKPLKNLQFKLDYTLIHKGTEYGYDRSDSELTSYPFMSSVCYRYSAWNFKTQYQLAYNMFFTFSLGQSSATGGDVDDYLPSELAGEQFNIQFGANIGF